MSARRIGRCIDRLAGDFLGPLRVALAPANREHVRLPSLLRLRVPPGISPVLLAITAREAWSGLNAPTEMLDFPASREYLSSRGPWKTCWAILIFSSYSTEPDDDRR